MRKHHVLLYISTHRVVVFLSIYSSGSKFAKFLIQICKIFCNFEPSKRLVSLGLKYFLKQISLNGDVEYCINHNVPIFYEQP